MVTTNRMKKLLLELLKNSHRSDRQLAREMGTSQPTVTRMRNKLEKNGWIKEYTIVPSFEKMGIQLMVITIFKTNWKKESVERGRKASMTRPNVIFSARAEGMGGRNVVVISLHRDYPCYADFIENIMKEYADDIETYDTLLVSLKGRVAKPLSLSYLAELLSG